MLYQLSFYVPDSHVEAVKTALFAAGAGRYQGYEHCAWQVLGQGQFRPLAGSQPFIDQPQQFEVVAEYKVEMICQPEFIQAAVRALLQAHPYQQPAYAVLPISYEFS